MWPIQLAVLPFIVFRIFLSSWTICNTSPYLTWSVQLIFSIFFSTTLQNFPGISDLLSQVIKFQHHTKLCSKCSTLLVSVSIPSPICWWIILLIDEAYLYYGSPGFHFPCTSSIICYNATQIGEIFHILRLFLIYHNLHWEWLPWVSHHLCFFHINFHSTASHSFS
jgi:hypothetical protein